MELTLEQMFNRVDEIMDKDIYRDEQEVDFNDFTEEEEIVLPQSMTVAEAAGRLYIRGLYDSIEEGM